MIDLWCYRRHGHNEGDEPSFTQPIMYKKIRSHPTTLQLYGKKLIAEGLISNEELELKKKKFKDFLNKEFINAKNYKEKMTWFDGVWSRFKPEIGKDKRGITGVEKKELLDIGKKITELPKNFNIHKTFSHKCSSFLFRCFWWFGLT